MHGGDNPYPLKTDKAEAWLDGIEMRNDTLDQIRGDTGTSHTPRRARRRREPRIIATADFETDPPGNGRYIAPFAFGFYDGTTYIDCWHEKAADKLVEHIRSLETPHTIYAHNGGKFDFQFIVKHLESKILFIGARIVSAFIKSNHVDKDGKTIYHELRDSLARIPVPLADAADKQKFDYSKMEAGRRDKYRREILAYLKQDCVELHRIVTIWQETFGDGLTMAGAAMSKLNEALAPPGLTPRELKSWRCYERMSPRQDEELRPWYFGGRVQCFQKGIIHASPNATLKIYDITSSYPDAMRRCLHPVGASYEIVRDITEITDFALIDATSDGCLPVRQEDGSLGFPKGRRTFHATGHEIRAGLDLGLLKIHRVLHARQCRDKITFEKFIDKYFNLRLEAKAIKDAVFDLFWKLVMNGAYGKFAQNPEKFQDHIIVSSDEPDPSREHGWKRETVMDGMCIWSRPTERYYPGALARSYLNVGTGASITGAARATLMYGLAAAIRPLYCDTDSIVCEGLPEALLGEGIGKWKLEAEGNRVAIAEKKLYAFFASDQDPGTDQAICDIRRTKYGDQTCIKIASKGVRLNARQLLQVAQGHTIEFHPLFPTLKPDGRQIYTSRRIKMKPLIATVDARG